MAPSISTVKSRMTNDGALTVVRFWISTLEISRFVDDAEQ